MMRPKKVGTWQPPERLYLDIETCSVQDLTHVGAYRYFQDKTTRVYLIAWAIGSSPVQAKFMPTLELPNEVKDWKGDYCGHNVAFERLGLASELDVRPPRLVCTMAKALYHGLPANLEDAAWALTGRNLKDKKGQALMKRWSRPRSFHPDTKKPVWWWEDDTEKDKLEQIIEYCKKDVKACRALDKSLPDLPERERKIWELDLAINDKGIKIDRRLSARLETLSKEKQENVVHALRRKWKSSGKLGASSLSVGNAAKLREWLRNEEGLVLPDVQKDTVEAALARTDLSERCRDVLEARVAHAQTSTAKFQRMGAAVCSDERLHGLLQHYGAGRTGRWAGRLVQPQNLPRPERGYDELMEIAETLYKATPELSWEDVDLFWGDSLNVCKDLIRSCFTASDKQTFLVFDYSQIEARVLAWLSGQIDVVKQFADGVDVYQYMGDRIANGNRTLGKVTVLACGYGMGVDKFLDTCSSYGIKIGREQAWGLVWGWRNYNSRIVDYWKKVEDAVLHIAGSKRTGGFQVEKIFVDRWGDHVRIELPSGRHLWYRNMLAQPDGLVFQGVDGYTRKWGPIRTWGGKLVENVTQAVARDVMASGMLRAYRDRQYVPVLTVHDEIVYDVPFELYSSWGRKLIEALKTPPKWAAGLPVDGDTWMGARYGKR